MRKVVISILTIIVLLSSANVAASPKKKMRRSNVPEAIYSYENLGHLALHQVCWDWRPVGWSIEFFPGRENYLGMCDEENKRISIWIRPEHSLEEVAGTLVHELAHAFDCGYLTSDLRAEWLELRKLPKDTEWDPPCDACCDFAYGTGDFAESMSWTLQGSSAGFRSQLGPPPDKAQQAFIRMLISRE
jgi:hypothetical protein